MNPGYLLKNPGQRARKNAVSALLQEKRNSEKVKGRQENLFRIQIKGS
jgi:hypothetical protein